VVLARREIVCAESPFDAVTVLRRLRRSYPECFTFALRHAGQTFLGGSPERLIAKRGLSVVTEALAGSISVTAENASDRLRASQKDLREHASVVRHVVERIESLATDLRFDAAPTVRALPNVLHLVTPIVATLDAPTHVLALVAALHPTPAVGGTPQRAAMEWIRAHEPVSRGWYAGPVGWFDDQGDGEFAVALRSGLLRGDEAWIFAGAGLVRGSDPDAEFDETALKLRPLLGALGVSA
ncbi:MAG: isochorismate synthase, partial [Myxococcales bacterium]|nr:isochorismate synthase [Myxococcales bacterium]